MSRGAVLIKINGDAAGFTNELKKVEKETKDVSAAVGKVAAVSAIGFTALTAAVGLAVSEYKEGVKVQKSIEQTIRSTGGAAGVTAKDVEGLALALQKVTNFGDETIMTTEGILLRFTNLKKDVLPQTTELALDMANKFGSAESAAEFLGKALNNPIKGMQLLRREGVVFTADQQKLIENLTRTGQVAEAQSILLERLQLKYGGQARAAADPVIQLREAVGDVAQVIGGVFAPAVDFAARGLRDAAFYLLEMNPTLIKIGAYTLAAGIAVTGLTAAITTGMLVYLKVTAIWGAYAVATGGAAAATGVLSTAVTGLGVAFRFLTGPLGIALTVLGLVGTAAYANWEKVKALGEGIKAFFSTVKDNLTGLFNGDVAAGKAGKNAAAAFGDAYTKSLEEQAANKAVEDAKAKFFESIPEGASPTAAPVVTDYEVDATAEKVQKKLDLEQQYADELFRIHEESTQLELNQGAYKANELARMHLEEKKRYLQDEAKYGKQTADVKAFFRKEEVTQTTDLFGTLSALTRSKNRELFELGKVAAIANATIYIAEGIAKAIAQGGFFGIAMGAAVAAAGAVQIATITGTQMNAAKGFSGSGSPFGESMISTFTPREIVVPERFSEGIKKGEYSLSSAKEQAPSSQPGPVDVTIGFTDDATDVLEVRRIERRKLGIGLG